MLFRIVTRNLGSVWLGVAVLQSMLPLGALAGGTIRSSVNPSGFGYNIDDSLINPTEPGKSETELTEQVAGILHAVRMDGGRTVRRFATNALGTRKTRRPASLIQPGSRSAAFCSSKRRRRTFPSSWSWRTPPTAPSPACRPMMRSGQRSLRAGSNIIRRSRRQQRQSSIARRVSRTDITAASSPRRYLRIRDCSRCSPRASSRWPSS
jgi:hypothetical protein